MLYDSSMSCTDLVIIFEGTILRGDEVQFNITVQESVKTELLHLE